MCQGHRVRVRVTEYCHTDILVRLFCIFLYYCVCFFMYFIVHAAFVRIKLMMMIIYNGDLSRQVASS